ncbi:MAG: FtsX-like permease family protein [Dehalococcoidia bacterium]
MVPLARRYLFSDRLRFAISTGGVAFAVLLIVLILALYQGIYDRAGRLATAAPSELWVTQAGAPDPSHGASILPVSVLDSVQDVPSVAVAQPLLARSMQVGESPNTGVVGFVMALPEGPLQIEAAEAFGVPTLPDAGRTVLSDEVAKELGVSSGDEVFIGDRDRPLLVTEVSSLVEGAFSGSVFINAEDAHALFGQPDSYSFLLVTLAPDADTETAETEIESSVPGTNALTREEFADATRREVEEGFLPIVAVLIGVAFVVGLAVIALTIYTSTVERVRDYGVLKAVGASPRQLFAVVLRQSVIVSLVGFGAGALIAVAAGTLIQDAVPEFTTVYRLQDVLAVLGASFLMSALAAIVPIRRVSRVDPAVVFRA